MENTERTYHFKKTLEKKERFVGGHRLCAGCGAGIAVRGVLRALREEGFGAVELCGAFGPERARRLSEAVDHQLAIGYVVHDPALDERFDAFFGA